MKKHLLILLLSLSFLISNSQESYILTKEGEKIQIAPQQDIYYSGFSIGYTTKVAPYGKKKKERDIGYLQKYYGKSKLIKPKLVEKIVDGDRLYLPFVEDKKVKIFRLIAKNSKYILGTYKIITDNRQHYNFRWQYVILDHDYNLIKQGRVFEPNLIAKSNKKDKEEFKNSLNEIKEYFGDCLGRNDDLFDLINLNGFEPNENYPMKNNVSLEKLSNDKDYKKKFYKYKPYFNLKFLYHQNQIQCD